MLKVLIIDDDEIVLLVERKMLQRCDICSQPLSFKGGEQALQYLAENHDEDVLILLDINMPEMNGWQFLSHLEKLQIACEIYVIMVTSSIDRYDKEVAQKYNRVIGFIEKPITAENCEKIKLIKEVAGYF